MESVCLDSLEVAGYADVLTDAMLPTIVPPLFRKKTTPPVYFLPPYSVVDGVLTADDETGQTEVDSMQASVDITMFEAAIAGGREGYELWIDQDRQPRYQPRGQVLAELGKRARLSLEEAERLLDAHEPDAASAQVSVAIASGAERYMVRALALKAAVRRLQNRPGSVDVLADMAAAFVVPAGFHAQVDHYVGVARNTPIQAR